MRGPLGELVTFKRADGWCLDGILYEAPKPSGSTLIHVHGSYGNFYQSQLVRLLAGLCLESGLSLLSFNTSGHDGFAEAYGEGEAFRYVGGAVAPFSESISDIAAAVAFVADFSDVVVLQGHSLGCDRVVNFLATTGARHDCILLAPCDSYRLQANLRYPETVEQQILRLRSNNGQESDLSWLPLNEYGVRAGDDWTYPNPITREALLSILEGPVFRLFRYDGDGAEWTLDQRAMVAVGGRDALRTASPETVRRFFVPRFRETSYTLLPTADHMFRGAEEAVAKKIVEWLRVGSLLGSR